MIAVWVGLSTGLTSNFSRAMGARRGDEAQQYLKATWTLVLLCVPVVPAARRVCWVFAERLSPDREVARQFAIYGSVLVGGSALTRLLVGHPGFDREGARRHEGHDVGGDLVERHQRRSQHDLHVRLPLGIFGIALSTVIGRFGGLVYALRKAAASRGGAQGAGRLPEVGGAIGTPTAPCSRSRSPRRCRTC